MKFKRPSHHRTFEVRHLFDYTPSHARLAFSRLQKVGSRRRPVRAPGTNPDKPSLVVNASAGGRSSKGEPI
jgi:hypothetical protein